MKKTLLVFCMMTILLAAYANADMSIQLKRTNPGIAGEKSAELIFDVVNTDFSHKIEGFIWCKSPDDAKITSSLGAGSGSGAQYVSPKFIMDVGPSQKALSLTLEADSPGDKSTGCFLKYSPFKETSEDTTTQVAPISWQGTVTKLSTDVEGHKIKLVSTLTAEPEQNETTSTEIVSVVLNVDGAEQEFVVGGASKEVGDLEILVTEAIADNATLTIQGEKTVTTVSTTQKMYLKMNGEYKSELLDSEWRELRLDKTVPFVAPSVQNPQCPEGQSSCTASEVEGSALPTGNVWWWIGGGALILLLVVFLLGKTSRKD